MRRLLKGIAHTFFLVLALPAACLAGFGRFHAGFTFFAQAFAQMPGLPGSYLRIAYYSLTLDHCSRNSHMAMGSFFSHAQASVGDRVSIGAYCVLGHVRLGDRTLISSGVQILSGGGQHARDASGRITDEGSQYRHITVGSDCWIGASSILMANVGDQVTVAVGSVVARDVPAGSVVAGNPARPVRPPAPASAG